MSLIGILLAGAAMAAPADDPAPVSLPFEILKAGFAVRLRIAGVERRMVLATESARSYLNDAPAGAVDVEASGASLGRLAFERAAPGQAKDADGAIGMDLLRTMAVGFDEFGRRYVIWPQGAAPTEAQARRWAGDLPEWGGPPKVRRIPLTLLADGAPGIALESGGKRVPARLSLGTSYSALDPAGGWPYAPMPKDEALLPDASIGGVRSGWLLGKVQPSLGVGAVVAQNALGSRRLLVDFSAGAAYAEEPTETERLSGFLSAVTHLSLNVEGDEVVVQTLPGSDATLEVLPAWLHGSKVIRIAQAPVKDWVEALRGTGEAGASRLAELLPRLWSTYKVEVQTPMGVRTATVTIGAS